VFGTAYDAVCSAIPYNPSKPTMNTRPLVFSARYRLRWEITAALAFKVLFLTWLWFACFKADPSIPKPRIDDIFSNSLSTSHPLETHP
jgi:hypothetical protein